MLSEEETIRKKVSKASIDVTEGAVTLKMELLIKNLIAK